MPSFVLSAAAVTLGLQTLGAVAAPTAEADIPKNQACCAVLEHLEPKKLSYPLSAAYVASTNSYWSVLARQSPKCIFSPDRTEDVALAVKNLVKYDCQFAVRGGGHTPQGNSGANIDGGVTIDLSKMKKVELLRDNSTVAIGPGARWIDVYKYLDPLGYAVPGGRVSDVGVAGLTTGGGNSFFTARYGLVCDNVQEFEMVLGSGEVVRATKGTRPDLFKAMKGASNNLGIVTRFDLFTFRQGPFWGGTVYYPLTTTDAQNKAFVNFNNAIKDDQFGSLIHTRAFDKASGQNIIVNSYEYTKPEVNPPIFHELLSIQPQLVNTMRISTLSDFTTELSIGSRPDSRDLFAALSFANDEETMRQVNDLGATLLEQNKNIAGLQWFLTYQPLPRIFTDHSLERGGNILGLDREKGNNILFLFNLVWALASDDAAIYKATDQMLAGVTKIATKLGTKRDYIYLNYAFPKQDPIGSYGPDGVRLLKEASETWDPKQVFQKLVPGGFKVSKVA